MCDVPQDDVGVLHALIGRVDCWHTLWRTRHAAACRSPRSPALALLELERPNFSVVALPPTSLYASSLCLVNNAPLEVRRYERFVPALFGDVDPLTVGHYLK